MGRTDQLEVKVRKGGVDAGRVGADPGGPMRDLAGAAVVIDGPLGEKGRDAVGVARVPGVEIVALKRLAIGGCGDSHQAFALDLFAFGFGGSDKA